VLKKFLALLSPLAAKASLSRAERKIVVLVVYVVVKLTMSSEAAKNFNITSYYSLLRVGC